MIVPVRNIKKLPQQARFFRPFHSRLRHVLALTFGRLLRKLLFVSYYVMVWVLFSVFSTFLITSFDDCTRPQHQQTTATSSLFSPYCTRDFATCSRSPSEGCCGSHCWLCRFYVVVWVLFSVLSEAIVGSVAFVLCCECCSVSFQLFELRYLVIEPVRNSKKLPGNLVLRHFGGMKHKIDPLTVFSIFDWDQLQVDSLTRGDLSMHFNLVFGWLRIHFLVRVIKFQETGGSRNLDSTISYFQKDGTV